MEASLIAGSMPVSPAPLRKAASTRSICHHSSSAADLLGSTQSSAPPRRSESLPRLGGYDLRVLESHAASPLPPPVYRIPRWQRAGWTFSPQADDLPVHEGTQTEDLACDDNEGPSSSGTYGHHQDQKHREAVRRAGEGRDSGGRRTCKRSHRSTTNSHGATPLESIGQNK